MLTIRSLPIYLLGILSFSSCQSPAPETTTETVSPPNVLFIAVDDLRPELGCYGKDYIQSPNIDRLASQGLVFNRAYCQQAVCSPSRTSLMTGLRPDSSHVYDLQTYFRDVVPSSVTTISEHFMQQGYHAEFWGKIFHAAILDSASWSVEGGNQDRRIEPQWPMENWRAYVTNESNAMADQNDGGGPPYERAVVPDTAYPDGIVAQRAIETLGKLSQQDQPFFLGVGFYKPHLPFNAPQKYWDLYDPADIELPNQNTPPEGAPDVALTEWDELRAYSLIPPEENVNDTIARNMIHGYRACVSYTDAQIGKVLDELEQLGLRENTIIILWGDHGWKLGDYGDWCKHTNFELDTRSPLIVSAPEMEATGKQTNALVEFVDIYPSLCELAGLPLPNHLQGKSFVPLMSNPNQEWKQVALSQFPRQRGEVMGYSMRTDRYRYTRWQDTTGAMVAQELYDHQNDPIAYQNLAASAEYADTVQQLDDLLTEEWTRSLTNK
ncbi:sulfatase [Tunicatimonas pelagia]|uniref:sulfatase n=1 Tax=Tunicatimonas pelagia TaxID=931531 RepID=UPI002666E4F1|nr:sulfatase [Tunicatimonas pelagia]WKN45953.1 sulfatase [Tunicatimonas pelagia]